MTEEEIYRRKQELEKEKKELELELRRIKMDGIHRKYARFEKRDRNSYPGELAGKFQITIKKVRDYPCQNTYLPIICGYDKGWVTDELKQLIISLKQIYRTLTGGDIDEGREHGE